MPSPAVVRAAVALLVMPAAIMAQAPDTLAARPIPLREAVALAEQNGLAAIQARGQTRAAASGVRAARGALLPSATISLGQVNQSGERLDAQGRLVPYLATQPWTYSTGLNSTVNLFDGGRRWNEVKRSRYDVGAAEANEVTQKYSLALQVKTQYYAILAAREAEAAAQAQLQQAQEQLKTSIVRTRAGVATLSDSLRSVIAVGNGQLALITARNNVRVASAALTRLVGSESLVTAQPSDTLDRGLAPVDSAALASVLDEAPTIRQSEAQLASAQATVKSAKTPYLPSVDLSYSRSGNGFSNTYGVTGNPLAYTNNFNIRLSYTLFNNFQREDALTRAEVTADVVQAQVRDAKLAAQQTLVQQLAALRSAQQRIVIQQATLDASREDLRVQQQRYALGASTLLDVLTSQSTLDAARSALIQARQDVRVARAQLEALVGRDLP
ncbi:MAG: TolC family protein [Polaromonas sp.]|nr:TolC family protein [Gemmatimonadaceae bacterium]